MYVEIFPYILGILLAIQTIWAVRLMRDHDARRFLVVSIGVVISAFIVFPLCAGDARGVRYEAAALVLLLAGLFCALRVNVGFLALTWIVHGIWDLTHILHGVSIAKPLWVSQICVPYDVAVGSYVLVRFRWRPVFQEK